MDLYHADKWLFNAKIKIMFAANMIPNPCLPADIE